jgi:hypothetical protein
MLKPLGRTQVRVADRPQSPLPVALSIPLFLLIMSVSTAIKLGILLAGDFDLSFDEAYYWHWSKNLDWCYFSKGPGVALLIAATTSIFGDTEFGVRVGALFCSTLTLTMLYLWTAHFFSDRRVALVTLLLAVAAPFMTGLGILTTIDSPMLLCWTMATISFDQALRRPGKAWWIALGLAIAVGTQFKFTMLFFFASMAAYALLEPADRSRFRAWEAWLVPLIVAVSLVPIAVWNTAQGWITLGHTLQKATVEQSTAMITLRHVLPSIGQQLGIMSPVLGVSLFVGLGFLVRDLASRAPVPHSGLDRRRTLFLLAIPSPILIFYGLLSFHRLVEANWMAVIYVTLLPTAAYYWLRPFRRWQQATLALALATGLAMQIPFLVRDRLYEWRLPDALASAGVPWKASIDMTNRLKGWEELGELASRRLARLERETGRPAFFATDHYSLAALVGFYTQMPDRVYVMKSHRIHNQFDLWAVQGRQPPAGATGLVVYDEGKGGRLAEPFFDRVGPLEPGGTYSRGPYPVRRYLFRVGEGFRPEVAYEYSR